VSEEVFLGKVCESKVKERKCMKCVVGSGSVK
jgi:hypothetical protein